MVKLIVAKAANNVIGKDNDLIWNLPADMKFFTDSTKGHIVIMGRKNWDSIPLKYRPLPGRENVIITRNTSFTTAESSVFHSVEDAILNFKGDSRDIYIIGGAQIYKYALDHQLVDEMFITYIDHSFEGDAFFPDFNESEWHKELIMHHNVDDKNPYPFKVYHFTRKH